ncbi:MAG: hypothetical protein K8R68_02575 [Bacteroidales bacterium]|nr:hypothetical protein [Bacteroidales bacterium]
MCEGKEIDIHDLPVLSQPGSTKVPSDIIERYQLSLNDTLYEVEKQLIQKAMHNSEGNKSKAARLLGIKVNLLYYKLEKYNLINKKSNR